MNNDAPQLIIIIFFLGVLREQKDRDREMEIDRERKREKHIYTHIKFGSREWPQ